MRYEEIAKYYEDCYQTHDDNNLGVNWTKIEDVSKRYQVHFDVIAYSKISKPVEEISLLDFGSGLGHFYEWIHKTKDAAPKYTGADINQCMCEAALKKYPGVDFHSIDLIKDDLDFPIFDFIVANGVFTVKHSLNYDEMKDFFNAAIKKLWEHCDTGLSFNLMSKNVDWERDDLFHVSMDELALFLKQNLSRNFVFRNDYGLYEYTAYVYKK
jgi:SAM-dependent methyltransferase